ncbi:hypothetical protein TSUD_376060 [Trifolium subterraneum]|uniref:Transposase MuDR plant domain-containing protein n=1 Tax=Trifolium subterraneum TaxID=3900 RepID=A0A2Z6MJ67_TRISU|nr:hypothetical protein TSUD_376060 [Trifolium subterraneum]
MLATHSQFEALCSIKLYVTLEDVHQIPTHQHQIETPSNDFTLYYQLLSQQDTQPFQSQPSSSTFTPLTHQADEPDNEDEEDNEESENEEDYVEQVFGHSDDDDDDSQPIFNPTHISSYNPPPRMRTLDLATIDQQTEVPRFQNQRLPVDEGIAVGMKFHTKADCVRAIRTYHIKKSLDYKVKQSDKERYVITCNQPPCKFGLRASERIDKRWRIGRISESHTCTSSALSQDHHKLNSKLIGESIVSLLHNDLSIKVKVIVAHIRDKFNYIILYRKAWIAKNKAIEYIYGSWVDSYHALPQWLMKMHYYLPNVVTILETLSASIPNDVDGTWLYRKYKGTLLLAVAQDGNNHIFPIAFAIMEGETKEAWNFFLKNLRTYNGWNDPTVTHVYCIRHIAQNFVREIKDKILKKSVTNMGYVVNRPLFAYYRNEIATQNDKVLKWVDNIPVVKWTQAFNEGFRWGHMTSNLVESMNSVFKEACQDRLTEEMEKANTHQVRTFDRQTQTFKALHLPCSHVIAACSHARQNYKVYINDVYKVASVLCVYDNTFPVIQDKSYWPQYQGRRLCPNPQMKRCKKGRPQSTRIRTEMDDTETLNRCGLCRTTGHNRNNCLYASRPSN